MERAKWEGWQHPKTKKFDGQACLKGRILAITPRQGYSRRIDLVNAIESCSGSREVVFLKWEDRTRPLKKKRVLLSDRPIKGFTLA